MANTTPTFLEPPAGRTPDSLPVKGAAPEVIDYDRVRRHIAEAVQRERYTGPVDPPYAMCNAHG